MDTAGGRRNGIRAGRGAAAGDGGQRPTRKGIGSWNPAAQRMRVLGGLAAALALWSAGGSAQELERELLRAEFDDKPLDLPIGTGGAALGEPFAVDEGVGAVVRAGVGADRELEVSADTLATASAVKFGLLDDIGVQTGIVQIDLTLTMPAYSYFNVSIREPRWSSHDFFTVYLLEDGGFSAQDAAGSVPLAAYDYVPGVPQQMRLTFDMDARTYDVAINETPLVSGRAHGITEAGVGQVQLTVVHQSAPQLFIVDDISAIWMLEDPVFSNGFDSDPGAAP